MFRSFMDIFPVFYEFPSYFSSYLSKLTFLQNLKLNIEKIFGAVRHLKLYFA